MRFRGQALTEFLVVALALVPLFLLVPLIARYQDMGHSAQLASRYAAFDASWHNVMVSSWKDEAQLAAEVRRRFFGHPAAPIKTGDVAGEFTAHRNPFWVQPQGQPLMARFEDVDLTFGATESQRHDAGFVAAPDATPFPLRSALGLAAPGIYSVQARVAMADLPLGQGLTAPFDRLGLVATRNTAILLDSWAASSPMQVESRIGNDPRVFPADALRNIAPVTGLTVTAMEFPGGLAGPEWGRLDPWRDSVPRDRLRP